MDSLAHRGHPEVLGLLPENCRKEGQEEPEQGTRRHQCGAYSGHRSRDDHGEDSWLSPEDRAMAWVTGLASPAGQWDSTPASRQLARSSRRGGTPGSEAAAD